MGHDELKKRILARRAKLVAAALAAGGLAATGIASLEACGGQTPGDAGADAPIDEPQACLSVAPYPDAASDTGADADAEPQPCLSPMPPDAAEG
jgi:hypothetical protein